MNRAACEKHGHQWIEGYDGWRSPVQTCRRWFCQAKRADPLLPPELQIDLNEMAALEAQARARN
jgi:hypothetical protein